MTLAEIAQGYRESELTLSARRDELRLRLADSVDFLERSTLEARIRCMDQMIRELRQIRELCERYYEKGFWRDDKYTFNPKPGCAGRSRAVAKRNRRRQPREPGPTSEKSGDGYSGGANTAAAGALADELIRRLITDPDFKTFGD